MSPITAESAFSPHLSLSTRLVHELGDPHSTLRATTDRNGAAVIINAGGEIDACNEHTWRLLVGEAASIVIPPGPFVIDVSGLEFMGCCAFAVLAEEAKRCRERG
ncbi:anti-sigma factor antagonist, partial [Mycobacterium sp. E796]|uniref:anti-sigma factor antagonist n=1 Tax=Mycobacterium sp. E796 TaxID=1834151 RepID=UPI0008010010